jgi:hypothetical protein
MAGDRCQVRLTAASCPPSHFVWQSTRTTAGPWLGNARDSRMGLSPVLRERFPATPSDAANSVCADRVDGRSRLGLRRKATAWRADPRRRHPPPPAPVRGAGRCHGDNRKPTVRAVDDSVCHRTRHHLDHAIVQDAPKRRRGMDRSFESMSYMFTVRRGGLFSGTPVPLALTEDVG